MTTNNDVLNASLKSEPTCRDFLVFSSGNWAPSHVTFLVNVSPPEPLEVETSNFVGE